MTGLSESTTKFGILSGNLGNARLVVLPNKFKKTDAQPTHTLFIAEREDRERHAGAQTGERYGQAPPRTPMMKCPFRRQTWT